MKQVVLSGAFSTGKSSLFNKAKEVFGDSCHYIEDGARVVAQQYAEKGKPQDPLDEATNIKKFQRDVMKYYLNAENKVPYNKVTISDGSLAEVLAYSRGVLDRDICEYLTDIIRYKASQDMYAVLKLPIDSIELEKDGLRHEDEVFQLIIDYRISQIWKAQNELEIVTVQKQITDLQDRFHYLYRMVRNLQTGGTIYDTSLDE